jgi:hypothetical protein
MVPMRSTVRCAWASAALACLLSTQGLERATASSSAPDEGAGLTWVRAGNRLSLRLTRGFLRDSVQATPTLFFPDDDRFAFRRASIALRPKQNVIAIRGEGVARSPFVEAKAVTVVVRVRPEIEGRFVRLRFAGLSREISRCHVQGPVCYLLRRAIDNHLSRGRHVQAFLDAGMNALLRTRLQALGGLACARAPVVPRRIDTRSEFLDIVVAQGVRETACVQTAEDFLPTGLRNGRSSSPLPI